MSVAGSFENLSGAVLIIRSLGWQFAIAETITFDETDGVNGELKLIAEIETLVTASDLRVRNTAATIIPAEEIEGFLTEVFIITDTDLTDASNYYYGGDDPAGVWAVNRYDKPGGTGRVTANESTDPAYTTIAAAWPNRTTLSYV